MHFDDKPTDDKGALRKFWGTLFEMITGPEHQYVYLKRLIRSYKLKRQQKEDRPNALKPRLPTKIKANLLKKTLTSDVQGGPRKSPLKNPTQKKVRFSRMSSPTYPSPSPGLR